MSGPVLPVYASDGYSPLLYVVLCDATGTPIPGQGEQDSPKGYQQILSGTLAASTALTIPAGATSALIQAEGGDVRWRDGGVDPTGAIGSRLYGDTLPMKFVGDLVTARFINVTGQLATLNVTYYG